MLGHVVLYSVFGAELPRDQLVEWFTDAGLDTSAVPQPPRRADAFVLAVKDAKATYPQPWRGMRVTAQVSIRRVKASADMLVYAMVRENRDPRAKGSVTTDTVADVIWLKKRNAGNPGPHQVGKLTIRLHTSELHDERERKILNDLASDLRQRHHELCSMLTTDRIRAVVRNYITNNLHGVRVKPKGVGDYFVLPDFTAEVRRLAEVVNRFGGESSMDLIDMTDHARHRQIVQRGLGLELGQDVAELLYDARRREPTHRAKLVEPVRALMTRAELYGYHEFSLPPDVADGLAELYELVRPET